LVTKSRNDPRIPDTATVPVMSPRQRHGSLSIGLPVERLVTGALNIYATEPAAFNDDTITLAHKFVGYAAIALANAHLYDTTATLAQQLQTAMDSRAVIEQAKGIIMAAHRCTADEAFTILSRSSQDSNRKLRDVATSIVQQTTRRGP
jgi:GAF domain-containing protein